MKFKTFQEFVKQHESSPWTRSRHAALMGLGPDIPEAGLNSRSTADPRVVEYSKKRKKKKKKKKKLQEADEARPLNKDVDRWLNSVDGLKRDLDQMPPDEDEEDEDDDGDGDDLEQVPESPDDEGDEGDEEEEDEISDIPTDEEPDFGYDDEEGKEKAVSPGSAKFATFDMLSPKTKNFKNWAKEKEQQ
jgi:hypothetical protein